MKIRELTQAWEKTAKGYTPAYGLCWGCRHKRQNETEGGTMKIRELTQAWEKTAKGRVTRDSYAVHLTLEDAARLEALHEMYPKRQIEDIITDLLGAALEELEASLPYRAGKEVIAVDEMGDPLYKDEGPTPRYLELSRKHLQELVERQQETQH